MSALRQSYLGRNAQGELCLRVEPFRTVPIKRQELCYIYVLPDELLSEVFAYLPTKEYWESWDEETEERFPLTLVSKRWRSIYETVLFHKIRVKSRSLESPLLRLRKLLAIVEARPHVRSLPRVIDLELRRPGAITCRSVADLLQHCTAVRKVSLQSDFTPDITLVLSAIRRLPLLENLHLSGSSSGPSIHLVLDTFALPTLKSLSLRRYGVRRSSADIDAPWPGVPVVPSQPELENLLPPNLYHTGNVTSLELSDPSTPAIVSEYILRWPARLVNLSLTWLTHSNCFRSYTTETVQRLLNVHRTSLKRITLGIIMGMPDFSNFPCLEELSMSAYNVMGSRAGSEIPSTALKRLSTPSLSYLTMSFSEEGQHPESASDFSSEQVRWIEEFAALKKSSFPASRLARISIKFEPWADPTWASRENTWPWEHVEQAKQAASRLGLPLDYGTPPWSKDEWDSIVAAAEVVDADSNAAVRLESSRDVDNT